ncbi:hypothetical protein GGF37_007101, partial [Kickxella alabastrina]
MAKAAGTVNGSTATLDTIPAAADETGESAPSAVAPAPAPAAPAFATGAGGLLARLPKTPDTADSISPTTSRRPASSNSKGGRPEIPDLHRPTTCPCGTSGLTAHYSLEALDAVFPLSLPLLFCIVFSGSVPADIERKYIPQDKLDRAELASSCTRRITSCGNTDVKTEGWVPDPTDPSREMCMYNYEKPLGFAIGPKSTMVEDTFRIVKRDFDQCVVIEQSVRTPNVPSGTAFCVKIRHCLSWTAGPSNEPPGGWSHYRMTFEVEWTKSSWIKNAIERGSNDSNKQAGEALEKFIREWIAKHPDMEVKARAGIVPATNGGSSGAAAANKKGKAHKRGSRKRMESPRGLRMEELV